MAYPTETAEAALEMVLSGATATSAALAVGARPATVARWCAAAGMALRPGRPPGRKEAPMAAGPAAERPARTSPR